MAAVRSSTKNLFAPPLKVSLALNCQSLPGKPASVDVSSNFRRTLFAFALIVAVPIDSVLVQSAPPQRPPAAETKSEKNVNGVAWGILRSMMLGVTTAPFATVNEPDCDTGFASRCMTRNSYV